MEKSMQKYLDKAEVLIEALPYIQRFNRKIIVVKYGGSAMVDETLKERVIQDVTLLKLVGFKPIIVHGGGKEISKWVGKVGMEPEFVNGLRVTDEATMELAEMVLGKVNKSLVQLVESLGVRAIGISGKDGKLLSVEKKYADGEDIGFVGEITHVNADILYDLLEKDFLPIVCPIGLDDAYQTYNINADDAACAIATAVKAEKLAVFFILLFILLIASFNIVGSIYMLILDKKKDLQTYRALGMTRKGLVSVFPGCISWTEGFPTVFCWRSLPTKESVQPF